MFFVSCCDQVLRTGAGEARYKFENPNPFISEEEEGEVASVAYRYKKWDLGGGVVSSTYALFL